MIALHLVRRSKTRFRTGSHTKIVSRRMHSLNDVTLSDEKASNDSYRFLTIANPFNGFTIVRIQEYSCRSTSVTKRMDTLSLEMLQKYLLVDLQGFQFFY